MKYILLYVIVLLALFANEALSKPKALKPIKKGRVKVLSRSIKHGGKTSSSDAKDFCKNKPINHGKQLRGGFCSPTVQGDIPNVNKMTSSFITFPKNEAVLTADKTFNVKVAIKHLITGFFSDPENEYYAEPQTLSNGFIKGHSHVTVQEIDDSSPPDAKEFVFFEGLNDKAEDGILVVKVALKNGKGLPSGRYRICAMSSSFTHQPLVMPVAKRGAQDDCIRITVEGGEHGEHGENGGKDKGKAKDEESGNDGK